MTLHITKDSLMDRISGLRDAYIMEAEYTEEERKRLQAADTRKDAGAAIVNETPKKMDEHRNEYLPTQADTEDDEPEMKPVATPKHKAASIVWITMGVALAAAAILLFVFLWNPDRKDVVTTTEAETKVETTTEAEATMEAATTEAATTEEATTEVPTTEEATTEADATLEQLKKAKIGEYITFGSYEQDYNLINGPEAIEWLVLEKEDDRMFVISRYGLEMQLYHPELVDVTWEMCSLREWLNSSFYDTAFAAKEKRMVLRSVVKAEKNPEYDTPAGNDTTDKVFLLSIDEANRYFTDDSTRVLRGTPYCIAHAEKDYDGNCFWWLRSPGEIPMKAANVDYEGATCEFGNTIWLEMAVRPAMWITLEPSDELEETTSAPETSAATGVAIDEDNFPDEVFRKHLLGYCDKDKDGFLSEEEIEKTTSLELNILTLGEDRVIHNLIGLEYLTSLRYLDCHGEDLFQLDVSRNTELRQLHCWTNHLAELDVSNNKELRDLDCSFNALGELDVSQNTALTSLKCSDNVLTKLDVSRNRELTTLVCSMNNLPELDVSSNTKLT
ncbi:MAG: hypothetical protein J6T47_10130, partial [Lachnospiraceae bacterium]|nr:hypothetical protein [Lachnospiraceae bacterium]